MSDKPMTSSAVDQIAPEPRARTASPAREDASEARRGSHSQRHSEVSAIIANANRDLARKASALSATLAAMDEAASIAAHNIRVDAERGEAPHEDRLRAQPDTPPEKVDAAHAGSPEDGAPAPADPTADARAVASVAEENRASASAVPPVEEGHTGRGHRQKKRRLMADGSLALEPSQMDARKMFLQEPAPRSARPAKPVKSAKPAKPLKHWHQYGIHPQTVAVATVASPAPAPRRPALLGASKPVPAAAIPSRETFFASVDAFLTRRDGRRPKTPVFNKAELDLYVVFCEVQALGGYDAVTMDKRWKRVCEALGRDLSTATSAGHSMRILYEKFLLDFETHLAGESGDPTGGRAAAVLREAGPATHRARSASPPASREERDLNTASDDNEDVDDATLEKLRLALRRQKAELESRLEDQERRERADLRRSGTGKAAASRFEGAWLSFGDACPLFDASRAYFARELPDLEAEKPRWAQCQLCAGWRDLGDPGTRKSRDPKRQLPRSARARARASSARA